MASTFTNLGFAVFDWRFGIGVFIPLSKRNSAVVVICAGKNHYRINFLGAFGFQFLGLFEYATKVVAIYSVDGGGNTENFFKVLPIIFRRADMAFIGY